MKGKTFKVGDKVRFNSASSMDPGLCTVIKTANYKSKGQRVYFKAEWGYGFMAWADNVNCEWIEGE